LSTHRASCRALKWCTRWRRWSHACGWDEDETETALMQGVVREWRTWCRVVLGGLCTCGDWLTSSLMRIYSKAPRLDNGNGFITDNHHSSYSTAARHSHLSFTSRARWYYQALIPCAESLGPRPVEGSPRDWRKVCGIVSVLGVMSQLPV
jgi:hypothetical protein